MRALALAAVLLALAGCRVQPGSDGGSGTVVAHHAGHQLVCAVPRKGGCGLWRTVPTYSVTIDEGGYRDTGRVSAAQYRACPVGARWPSCKRGAH